MDNGKGLRVSVCVTSAELTGGIEKHKEPFFVVGLAADGIEPNVVTTAPMAYVDGPLPLIGYGLLVLSPVVCSWACVQISMLESDAKTRKAGKVAGKIIDGASPILVNLNPIASLALPLASMFAGILAGNADDPMISTIWSGFSSDNFAVPEGQNYMSYTVENKRAKLSLRIGLH